MKAILILFLTLSLCCSDSHKKEESEESSNRKPQSKYQALVEQFGEAIAQKDYESAYALTSANFQQKLSYDKFVETWRPYRDSFSGAVKTNYTPSDDPQEMSEFVSEADRPNLVEEITIAFEGIIDGEEAEFYCTTWVIDDGTPRIGSFYVED